METNVSEPHGVPKKVLFIGKAVKTNVSEPHGIPKKVLFTGKAVRTIVFEPHGVPEKYTLHRQSSKNKCFRATRRSKKKYSS
jgi:hypothetical protein